MKLCLSISTNEQAIDTAAGRSGPAAGRDLSNAMQVISNKRAKITANTILCYTVGRMTVNGNRYVHKIALLQESVQQCIVAHTRQRTAGTSTGTHECSLHLKRLKGDKNEA